MEDPKSILKNRRSTRQKASILHCLKNMQAHHVTAEELIKHLEDSGISVGKATVYRYLSELEQNGKLRRYLGTENGPSCYQYIAENSSCREHYHLLCTICRHIVHFDDPELETHFRRLNKTRGFEIDDSKLVFYGICPNCNQLNLEV